MKAMWVTDRAACGEQRFEAILAALAGASGLCVQLREKDLADLESLALARRCRAVLGPGENSTDGRRHTRLCTSSPQTKRYKRGGLDFGDGRIGGGD